MTLTEMYRRFVRHGNFTKNERDSKFLAAMGLNGEAGEVSEIIKKHLIHGDELDKDHLIDEMGDVLWYFFHTLIAFDISLEEVIEGNVRKLCNRHPDSNGPASDWLPSELLTDPVVKVVSAPRDTVSLNTGRTIPVKSLSARRDLSRR